MSLLTLAQPHPGGSRYHCHLGKLAISQAPSRRCLNMTGVQSDCILGRRATRVRGWCTQSRLMLFPTRPRGPALDADFTLLDIVGLGGDDGQTDGARLTNVAFSDLLDHLAIWGVDAFGVGLDETGQVHHGHLWASWTLDYDA